MRAKVRGLAGALPLLLWVAAAAAYPGGTPGFQTDAAPFCAGCHSSRTEAMLANAPPGFAAKQMPDAKHYPLILEGKGGYESLTAEERKQLVAQLKALDDASTIVLEAPASVAAGETFEVVVKVTGGAGPVVGVALVDADQRWLARPAAGAGWRVVGAPRIEGQDGAAQTDWLDRRPQAMGRNLSYVNVSGIASDAAAGSFGHALVRFTLRAPAEPGSLPLSAAYWYGTEKGTPLGYTTDPVRGKLPRGGFGGPSGRILFSAAQSIAVTE